MNIYLYLDERDVIRDVKVVPYVIKASNYIPYHEQDMTLVGKLWDRTTETAATSPYAEPFFVSKWTFRQLFTIAEMAAIYTAAETDVNIRVYLDDIKMVEEVDLAYEPTVNGINYLVFKGLLTEQRATEIISYRG